jgi:outer membrane protein assembly factor BamB
VDLAIAKHRWATAIIITFLLTTFSLVATQSSVQAGSSGDNWSMFHYDPAHTGYTNSAAPTSTPVVLWKTETYGPVYSSPAVVDGVVYVSAWFLHAFNVSTGTEIWNVLGGELSSPIVIGGYVYTGNNGSTVYNASTGEKIWSNPWRGYSSSTPILAVYGNYVYTGYEELEGGWVMRALNASTGTEVWKYPTEPLSLSPPAVSDGYIYFGTENGVCALNAYTGAKLWEYETGDRVESSPAVSGGIVYFSSNDGNFYALSSSTGGEIWSSPIGGRSSPAVAGGRVFVGSLDDNVYALNASTGAKIWNYTTGYIVDSSPAIASGTVYIGSDDGNLYALDASSGTKLWNFTIQPLLKNGQDRYLFASPAVANGTIYMGSTDGIVFALGPEPKTTPSSPSPNNPEFSYQILGVTIFVSVLIVVALYVIARKRATSKAAKTTV